MWWSWFLKILCRACRREIASNFFGKWCFTFSDACLNPSILWDIFVAIFFTVQIFEGLIESVCFICYFTHCIERFVASSLTILLFFASLGKKVFLRGFIYVDTGFICYEFAAPTFRCCLIVLWGQKRFWGLSWVYITLNSPTPAFSCLFRLNFDPLYFSEAFVSTGSTSFWVLCSHYLVCKSFFV